MLSDAAKTVLGRATHSTEIGALIAAYQNAFWNSSSSSGEAVAEKPNKTKSDAADPAASTVDVETKRFQELVEKHGLAEAPLLNFCESAESAVAALVHWKFGMPVGLQRVHSSPSPSDGAGGRGAASSASSGAASVTTHCTAVAVSAAGTRYFLGSGASAESPARAEQLCLQSVINTHFASHFSLAVLDHGERIIAFPGSSTGTSGSAAAQDAHAIVRRYLSKTYPNGWTLCLRTVRQWHENDRVDTFIARIVAATQQPASSLSSSPSFAVQEICRHESSDSLTEALSGCMMAAFDSASRGDKMKLARLLELSQTRPHMHPQHFVNLLVAAQRLLAKGYGLQLVASVEKLAVKEVNTMVWYVKLYIDARSTTVNDTTTVVSESEGDAFDNLNLSSSSGNNNNKKKHDEIGKCSSNSSGSEHPVGCYAVPLDSSGIPAAGCSSISPRAPLNARANGANKYKLDGSTLLFTGCVARDVQKRDAETKAAYRFIAANFPDVVPTMHERWPELCSLASVKEEANALRGTLSSALASKERERHERLEKHRHIHNLNQEVKRLGLKGIGGEKVKRADAISASTSSSSSGGRGSSRMARAQRAAASDAAAEAALATTEAIRRFRRGSHFESVESDMKRNKLDSGSNTNSKSGGSDDADGGVESFTGEARTPESSSASSSSASITSAAPSPLRDLLRSALREEREMELRVQEQRIGSGFMVYLYGIPINDDDTLDLSGEVELASETGVSAQKALAMACYCVLQDKFAEKLVEAVSENERLLDLVLE